MLVSDNKKPLKRFSVCFKKNIDENLTKLFEITPAENETDAINKVLTRKKVPIRKISRESDKEGYIYCNEIYNPSLDDETN